MTDASSPGRHYETSPRPAPDRPVERPTSYGAFLADPPYTTEEQAEAGPSDAGLPPHFPMPDPDPPAAVAVTAPSSDLAGTPQTPPSEGPRERVTCPECGATQEVALNRRDSDDFCRRCDFPLFWVPARIARERELAAQTESLRRLPGTVGRSTLASVACPHCAELNTVSAEVCVRCGKSMHPVEAPPPPPPPPPPAPEPEPVYVPESGTPWWIWLVVALGVVTVALVVLVLTGVIN